MGEECQATEASGVAYTLAQCDEWVGQFCRFPHAKHPKPEWRNRMCKILEQADEYLDNYDKQTAEVRVQETGTMMAWDNIRTTMKCHLRSWEAYGPPPELRQGLLPQQPPRGPRGA